MAIQTYYLLAARSAIGAITTGTVTRQWMTPFGVEVNEAVVVVPTAPPLVGARFLLRPEMGPEDDNILLRLVARRRGATAPSVPAVRPVLFTIT